MRTPTRFKLFVNTIEVGFDNVKLSDQDTFGECSYSEGYILLCDKYKDKEVTYDCIASTFYHEKVHLILDAMGEYKLSKNEKFVELFSQLLRQSDETAEY